MFVCVDAVRMNSVTNAATNRMVEDKIKSWLRQARDRAGGRKRRYLQAQTHRKKNRLMLEDIATDVEDSVDSVPSSENDN